MFFIVTEPCRGVYPGSALTTAFPALEVMTSAGGDAFLETWCGLLIGIDLLWVPLANVKCDFLGLHT